MDIPRSVCYILIGVEWGADICEMNISLLCNQGWLIEFPTCKWKKRLFALVCEPRVGFWPLSSKKIGKLPPAQ